MLGCGGGRQHNPNPADKLAVLSVGAFDLEAGRPEAVYGGPSRVSSNLKSNLNLDLSLEILKRNLGNGSNMESVDPKHFKTAPIKNKNKI